MILLPGPTPYTDDLLGARLLPRPRSVRLTAFVAGTTRRVVVRDSVAGVTRTTPASFAANLWAVPSGLSGRIDAIVVSQPATAAATTPYIFNDASWQARVGNGAANSTAGSFPASTQGINGRLVLDADLAGNVTPITAGDQIAVSNPGSPVDGWTVHVLMSLWPTSQVAYTNHANIASATPTTVYTCPAGKVATLMSAGYGRHESACRFASSGGGVPAVRFWQLESGETSTADDRLLHAFTGGGSGFGSFLPVPVRLTAGQSLVFQHTGGGTTNSLRSLWILEDA